jgi:4-azaleucine resistance transporter AzlC
VLSKKQAFILGCKDGWPIAFGYFSISVTFGVLAAQGGLSTSEATAMSIWVFAGASQFIALSLLSASAGWIEIVLATFVLNLRHLLMSTTLARRVSTTKVKAAILSFGITDETFVVATIGEQSKEIQGSYFAGIAIIAYSSWISGTLVGGLFGEFIPTSLTNSMGIALYAMFIALLVPAIKHSMQKAVVAGAGASLCTLLYFLLPELSYGWAVVISTIFASTIGLFLSKEEGMLKEDVA